MTNHHEPPGVLLYCEGGSGCSSWTHVAAWRVASILETGGWHCPSHDNGGGVLAEVTC